MKKILISILRKFLLSVFLTVLKKEKCRYVPLQMSKDCLYTLSKLMVLEIMFSWCSLNSEA